MEKPRTASTATSVLLVAIALSVATACNNAPKKPDVLTTKEHPNAETRALESVQAPYKGEMTATASHKAFSKKAEEEGLRNIALLYNAVSTAENIHATNHKTVTEYAGPTVPVITPAYSVKTTKDNLAGDINGESNESTVMYPNFPGSAGNQIAFLSVTYATKTEAKGEFFFRTSLGTHQHQHAEQLAPDLLCVPRLRKHLHNCAQALRLLLDKQGVFHQISTTTPMDRAHAHLPINHLPIFGSVLGGIALAYGLFTRSNKTKTAAYIVFVISAVGAGIAYFTGEGVHKTVENMPGVVIESVIKEHGGPALAPLIAPITPGASALVGIFTIAKPALTRSAGIAMLLISPAIF